MDVDLVPNQVPIEHPLSTLSMYPSSGSTRMLSSSMDPQWPVEYPTFFTCSGRLPAIQVVSRVNVYIRKRNPIHLASKMCPYIYITAHTYYIYIYICLYLSSHQRFALIPETITQKNLVITISLAYHVPQILAVFPSPKRAKVTLYLYIHIPSGHLT